MQLYKLLQACWDKGIFVIQKPTKRGGYKKAPPVRLIVDIRGNKRYGKQEYEQNTKELYDKIAELYEFYYFRD